MSPHRPDSLQAASKVEGHTAAGDGTSTSGNGFWQVLDEDKSARFP